MASSREDLMKLRQKNEKLQKTLQQVFYLSAIYRADQIKPDLKK